ncbi:unnamed protein product [Brachionus calyciflorus]|uniref:Uncharacterized protein n=1 Tax=Brachionus calyciflorus TaxID=104777 RepID=A0A814PHQ7_9BILA|nr:unnamed protein product [Brachionus calyciflorus]
MNVDVNTDQSLSTLQILLNSNTINCKSSKLNLDFQVHIHNETNLSNQKCFIMTIHDLGSNHMQFEKFINCPQMTGLRNRVIWLNVNLPGQGPDAETMTIKKYPSLEELGEELVCILDQLKIPQVVCMGVGVGANIISYFALKNTSRCLGLIILEPIASSAGIFEAIRKKFNSFQSKKSIGNISDEIPLDHSDQCLFTESYNSKNMALFAQSFFQRSCILNQLGNLRIDAMIAVGKLSPLYTETKKFYKTLQDLNKKTPQRLVNSPYLEIDNCVNILKECPERLTSSLQYFLQGIGLLSAMPMQKIHAKPRSIISSILSDSICDEMSSSSSIALSH